MGNELPLPADLQHLLEKRTCQDRRQKTIEVKIDGRKTDRREATSESTKDQPQVD
jgi:hypothetical protein